MIEKAGKNYKPQPLEDSDFYFFKGYLIRISKTGQDIWLHKRLSYQSNMSGYKALEKAMEEVYKLIELEEEKKKADFEKARKEKEAREKLEPFINIIAKSIQ